jgi:hypothetical protein
MLRGEIERRLPGILPVGMRNVEGETRTWEARFHDEFLGMVRNRDDGLDELPVN